MVPAYLPLAAFALVAGLFGPGHAPGRLPAARVELSADSVAVPMTLLDGRVVVEVTIAGRGPFPFVFDTGAQGSVMDVSLARELGLDLGQEIQVGSPGGKGRPGWLVTIDPLAVGGLALRGFSVVAFDGLPFPRTAKSPRGVLGPYGLNGLLVTLDYPRLQVVFRKGALPEPDGREIFGWESGRPLPEFPVTVAGRPAVIHMDTGAPSGLSLPTSFQDLLPLEGPLADMGYAKTVDRVRPVRGATLRGALTIGRYTLDHPTIRFLDLASGVGSVGAAILGQFVLTLDPAQARLRLEGPADGRLSELGERKAYYGVQLDAVDAQPPVVQAVDTRSPAEKGGLRAGDRLARMNGRPVEEMDLDARLAALRESPLELTVRRGDSTLVLTMTLR
jgi:hypothetical protein